MTDASNSVYVDSLGSWYSPRQPFPEILGPGFIQHLRLALDVPGLAGVSRLLGLMAITELQNLQKYLGTELAVGSETGKLLEMADSSLNEPNQITPRTYSGLSGKMSRQMQVGIVN